MIRLAAIVLVCAALPAVAAPPSPPALPGTTVKKKVVAVTQGAGAIALTAKVAAAPAPRGLTNYFFFAATALDTNKLESSYSSQVIVTNVVKLGSTNATSATLSWDYPYTNWPGVKFNVYRGAASSNYTAVFPAGTNHSLKVPFTSPRGTNLVITATGSTNCCITNPVAKMMLWKGTNMHITASWQ